MKTAKYPHGKRTKREFIQAIKNAPGNALFFSRDTMNFFGRQKFGVSDDGAIFYVEFLEKCPRIAEYVIDENTLKLTPRTRA